MRVLLVNPDERSLVRSPNLPLGYLAAAVEAAGHAVRVVDVTQKGWDLARVDRTLAAGEWDLVGFQVYSCGWDATRALARTARQSHPAGHVLVGGRHVSALGEEVLREEPNFDFALLWEAEETLPRLLSALERGGEGLDAVPNLIRRHGDGFVRGPPAELPDLDRLPFPAWEQIAPRLYPDAPQGSFVKAFPIAPMVTSRGCPYACRFCAAAVGANGSRTVRFRDPVRVGDEVSMLVERHGIREIQFLDDNFTLRRSHATAVCEELLRRGHGLALSLPNGVRLDRLDAGLVRLLERAGCYSLTVGIDSGSQRVLDLMDRKTTLEVMEERIRLIKENSRIRVTGNFILGLPGETLEDMELSIAYARRVPLDRAYFAMYLPLPGSPLFDELRAAGRLNGFRYSDLAPGERAVPFTPDGVSPAELRRALVRAYRAFYLRPSILAKVAGEVRSLGHARFLAGKAAARLFGRKASA